MPPDLDAAPDDPAGAAAPSDTAAAPAAPKFPVPLDSIADAAGILCPDDLCRALGEALPGRLVVPFCASPTLTAGQIGAVVLHKPSMHRLDFGLLAEIAVRFVSTYAVVVYAFFWRYGRGEALPPEMALHIDN